SLSYASVGCDQVFCIPAQPEVEPQAIGDTPGVLCVRHGNSVVHRSLRADLQRRIGRVVRAEDEAMSSGARSQSRRVFEHVVLVLERALDGVPAQECSSTQGGGGAGAVILNRAAVAARPGPGREVLHEGLGYAARGERVLVELAAESGDRSP